MKKIGLLYGSTTGNTEEVAEMIANEIGTDNVDVLDVANISIEDVMKYERLIMGISTWGSGEMQDDWEEFVDALKGVDLSGKKVALFGIGDGVTYSDTFVGGMGELYEAIKESGAEFFGKVSTEGYDYDESPAEENGMFVGLALDQDNEDEKSEERIHAWVADLKDNFC
jgi:flavodoxin I